MLRKLGIAPDTPLLVETTEDGAIVLRRWACTRSEIYSDERLAEFERENQLTPEQLARYGTVLADFPGWLRTQAQAQPAARRPSTVAKRPRAAKR